MYTPGLTQFPPRTRGTFGTYIKCLFSDKGDEPSGPFVYLDSDKPMFGKQVHYLPEEEEQAEE